LIFLHQHSAHLLLSSKIDISFYNWKIMHTDNAYLIWFWSSFLLCSDICILRRSNYLAELDLLNDNLCVHFSFNFCLKAFNYKQVSTSFSIIALLKCIIMYFLVLALLFYLMSDIVFHNCFVYLIHFFSNIELS